jgi:hypothetical protein
MLFDIMYVHCGANLFDIRQDKTKFECRKDAALYMHAIL